MLRRLRRRRTLWAAICAGLAALPAMLGGANAMSADPSDPIVPPSEGPREALPPDPATVQAALMLAQSNAIADLAPEAYRRLVVETANRYQVDPRLVAAVITVESRWHAQSVGGHGEKGLMQILPSTGAFLARAAGLSEYDLSDPATNLDLGVFYLAQLLEEYGSPERALAAYNGGPRAVANAATNLYAKKVLRFYHQQPPVRTALPDTIAQNQLLAPAG